MAASPADFGGSSYCLKCGKELTKSDRDRLTCAECRSPVGKIADLEIAICASGDSPDRIREWPGIRHVLRKRFGDHVSDLELWERFTDFLRAERGITPDEYLFIPLTRIETLLADDADSSCGRVVVEEQPLPSDSVAVVSSSPLEPPAAESTRSSEEGTPTPGNTDPVTGVPLCVYDSAQPCTELLGEEEQQEPQQFSGGKMVFFADRVEFCGVDICSGPRSKSKRIVLELLGKKRSNGSFIAYSGTELEGKVEQEGGKGISAGLIRDLRHDITESLRNQANIDSGHKDVILSGGPGYRFTECITVQDVDPTDTTKSRDKNIDSSDPDDPNEDGPNGPNEDDPNNHENPGGKRREWILERLGEGQKLQAPDVAKQFDCSKTTAKRDLQTLKAENRIEFIGSPRKGHYRLKDPPEAGQQSS